MNNLNKTDFIVILIGSAACFALASLILSGWDGIVPNLKYPFVYAGDAHFTYGFAQRASESWIFNNIRMGFPFESSWFDFPSADAGNFLILAILVRLSGNYYAGTNLYLLLGFPITFVASYVVVRKLHIRSTISILVAILFTFSSYHFSRIYMGHFFYSWYFVVPIYFYSGYLLLNKNRLSTRDLISLGGLLIIAANFGVYFAFFGVFTIIVLGLISIKLNQSLKPLISLAFLIATIVATISANLIPNLSFFAKNGKNTEVAIRHPSETEVYALKPIHLLVPPSNHRIESLAKFGSYYQLNFPLSNTVSYVGIVGILGIFVIFTSLFNNLVGIAVDFRLKILTLLSIASVILITVGGLNVLFSIFISPLIRGWDRFSIFILFYLLTAFGIFLNNQFNKNSLFPFALSFALCILGLWDQTAKSSWYIAHSNMSSFKSDLEFIQKIESSLPSGSAIYQVPFIEFPEVAPINGLGTYDHLRGFINSSSLNWSFGGMKGRKSSDFYKALSQKPIMEQVIIAKSLGFYGIYVQKNGFKDNGKEIIETLKYHLGPPKFSRSDDLVVYFDFHN